MFRTIKIKHYIASMQARGFSPDAVLADSGITQELLDSPDYLVSLQQSQRVVSNMIELTGDQGLGFQIGDETTVTELGIMGHALLSTRTVRDMVKLWSSYSNSLLGILSAVSLSEESSDYWTLAVAQIAPSGFIFNFCAEEFLMTTVRLGPILSHEPLTPAKLELSYPAPAHQELYRQHFMCPIRFNCAQTRITFASPHLDSARPAFDTEFDSMCLRLCGQLARQTEGQQSTLGKLRNFIVRNSTENPGIDTAASAIGMSARSLRRQLFEQGVTYRSLVDDVRRELAQEYLRTTHDYLAVKEIAFLLGFKDVNAFRRTFRRWSGMTIGDYRRRAKSDGKLE